MSSIATHTPGPWAISGRSASCIRTADQEQRIAYLETADNTFETCEANARLIAAAPDLLEALESLLDAYSKPDERLCCDGRECGCMGSTVHQMAEHYARAAIAKAEGRS